MQEKVDYVEKTEVFSKAVRAGKRTYFFDIKSTKDCDFYLTITESKRVFDDNGKFYYDKHKIFLYPEDMATFIEGLNDSIGFINKAMAKAESKELTTISDLRLDDIEK